MRVSIVCLRLKDCVQGSVFMLLHGCVCVYRRLCVRLSMSLLSAVSVSVNLPVYAIFVCVCVCDGSRLL